MLLVERGQLNLSDRVTRYIPEFTGQGKEAAQVLHLFTHTSGLPDELPNNAELRQAAGPAEAVHRGGDPGRPAVPARHPAKLFQLRHHPRRRDRPAAVGAVDPRVRAPRDPRAAGPEVHRPGLAGVRPRAAGARDGARLPGRTARATGTAGTGRSSARRPAGCSARPRTSPSSAP